MSTVPVAAAISGRSSGATKSKIQSISSPGPAMKPSRDIDLFTTTLPLISRPVLPCSYSGPDDRSEWWWSGGEADTDRPGLHHRRPVAPGSWLEGVGRTSRPVSRAQCSFRLGQHQGWVGRPLTWAVSCVVSRNHVALWTLLRTKCGP